MKSKICLSMFALILCVSVFLGGCSQTVCLSTVYADGSRSYNYTIQLNPSDCASLGIDSTRALELIHTGVTDYWNTFSSGRNLVGVNFESKLSQKDVNTYVINWSFNSFEAYLNFYGLTASDLANNTTTYKKGLFVSQAIVADTDIQDTNNLLLEMHILPTLTTNIEQSFADEFFAGDTNQVQALFTKIQTNLVYAYPSSLKIRTNADEHTQFLGNVGVTDPTQQTVYDAYLWKCTLAEPTPHIYIYRNVYLAENRTAWYILAMGIALILGLILFIIFYFKNKNNNLNDISNNQFAVDLAQNNETKTNDDIIEFLQQNKNETGNNDNLENIEQDKNEKNE